MMARADDPKEQFNARLQRRTLSRLRQRAERTNTAQTALAERYIDEGLRMDDHPLIYFRDGAAGRRPAIVGTRHDVAQVIETIRQNGNSIDEAAAYLRLPRSHVEACVGYYADYQDEIDDWIARKREAAEQAETSWRRRQELFG